MMAGRSRALLGPLAVPDITLFQVGDMVQHRASGELAVVVARRRSFLCQACSYLVSAHIGDRAWACGCELDLADPRAQYLDARVEILKKENR